MQVYSGMDIITNKVPEADRQGVEHLLMGIREPWEQYVVGEWVHDAMQIVRTPQSSCIISYLTRMYLQVDETHRRNQIPIVVGGTSYWIQHLLFPDRLVSPLGDSTRTLPAVRSPALSRSIASLPPELLDLFNGLSDDPPASSDAKAALALYHLLAAIDPPIAARWHWRDIRKVLRSLLIIKEQGRLNSEVIDDQSSVPLTPRSVNHAITLYSQRGENRPGIERSVFGCMQLRLLSIRDSMHALKK
jgi:tRNA dimethylallyltransferase